MNLIINRIHAGNNQIHDWELEQYFKDYNGLFNEPRPMGMAVISITIPKRCQSMLTMASLIDDR